MVVTVRETTCLAPPFSLSFCQLQSFLLCLPEAALLSSSGSPYFLLVCLMTSGFPFWNPSGKLPSVRSQAKDS
jgi:hypothetical protein